MSNLKEIQNIKIKIKDREGVWHTLEAPTDMNLNLMEVSKMYDLPVAGECGGMALCATCQMYKLSDHDLDPQSDAELDMLDQAFHVKENSRLGCQIYLKPELDGLEMELAPE